MAANYLHGVETIELNKGPVPVQVVKSAVIGLVGVAPMGPVNTLTVVQNAQDAAQFGSPLGGFSIPQAIDAILKQGGATILVVNTLDEGDNLVQVTDESLAATSGGKTKTEFNPVKTLVVKKSSTVLDLDADYSVDEYGNIQILDYTVVPEGTALTASYKKFDETTVGNTQIIGSLDSGTGVRTGFKLFDLAFNMFGFTPRIFIAPLYSHKAAIGTEMIAQAEKFRAHALLDAPQDTRVAAVVTGRGPAGSVGKFNTSSKRAVLCYPWLKAFDANTEEDVLQPFSQFLAGVIASTDREIGYWASPSNKEIKGITGVELNLSAAVNDPDTDVNLLNEKGILTIFNSFGTGIRTWGNRSAAFPTSTKPSNFICVQRTADIIHESLELATLQFIDNPLNQATIDSIRETVNSFIRSLIQRGALVDGVCTFDRAKNSPVELAAGHVTFDITFMPPTPAERITFDSFIDINLLKVLS